MEIPKISNTQIKAGTVVTGEVYELFGMKLQVVEDSDKTNKDKTWPMTGTVMGCLECALEELCHACQHNAGLGESFMPYADSNKFNNRHFIKVK